MIEIMKKDSAKQKKGLETKGSEDRKKEIQKHLSSRAGEYFMFMDYDEGENQ